MTDKVPRKSTMTRLLTIGSIRTSKAIKEARAANQAPIRNGRRPTGSSGPCIRRCRQSIGKPRSESFAKHTESAPLDLVHYDPGAPSTAGQVRRGDRGVARALRLKPDSKSGPD